MKCPPNVRRGELRRLFLRRGESPIEVANLVEDFMIKYGEATPVAVGNLLQLTWEEKKRGIKTIACIDRAQEEVTAYYLERRRERDRIRKKEQRLRDRRTKGISPGAKQLAGRLNGNWVHIRDLVESAGFRHASSGKTSKRYYAAKQAVLRAGQELSRLGIAELKTEPIPRGGWATFLRWNPATTFRREDFPLRNGTARRPSMFGRNNQWVGP